MFISRPCQQGIEDGRKRHAFALGAEAISYTLVMRTPWPDRRLPLPVGRRTPTWWRSAGEWSGHEVTLPNVFDVLSDLVDDLSSPALEDDHDAVEMIQIEERPKVVANVGDGRIGQGPVIAQEPAEHLGQGVVVGEHPGQTCGEFARVAWRCRQRGINAGTVRSDHMSAIAWSRAGCHKGGPERALPSLGSIPSKSCALVLVEEAVPKGREPILRLADEPGEVFAGRGPDETVRIQFYARHP